MQRDTHHPNRQTIQRTLLGRDSPSAGNISPRVRPSGHKNSISSSEEKKKRALTTQRERETRAKRVGREICSNSRQAIIAYVFSTNALKALTTRTKSTRQWRRRR